MESEKLKGCPFCGGEAHWCPTYIDSDMPGVVQCANACGATVITSGTKVERIAAWNTRAPADLRSALEAETIERCAKVAEDHGAAWVEHQGFANVIATAIRALAPTKGDV